MSTFTNGTGTVSIDFNIEFDLRTTPTLKITDSSTYSAAQTGVKVFIKITRPDGFVRDINADVPDITGNSGSLPVFNYILSLANDGDPVRGVYKIEYNFTVGSASTVKKTKSFDFQYKKNTLTLEQDINEFTPLVKVKDTTANYDVSGYTTSSISRVFTGSIPASSKTLHTKTTTGSSSANREYRLEEVENNNVFYDSEYTITCSLTSNHTSATYSWATLKDTITKTIKVNVHKPPTKAEMIDDFDALRNLVELYDGQNKQLYDKYSADYEFVMTSFDHLTRRLSAGDSDKENNEIIKDIIAILRNDVSRTHTNLQLTATSVSIYGSIEWGNISGKPTYNPFQTFIQSKTTATWQVNHNLGKYPSVTTVDDNGNLIYGDVVYNSDDQITITFSAGVSGKVYLN
tara:strand:- start:1869 stop:3077 length:1209 start_codon:yes stop_codon:yes gene_type:complete